jgi:hypothetical protein
MADDKRGGRQSAGLTKLVIATYGPQCHLRLPGCTNWATTKDHLIPYSHGGTADLVNLRPCCRSCNSKRGNQIINGYGARVVVVIGPPASGKTTFVLEHAGPNDLTIDLDALARALMPVQPTSSHSYPQHVRDAAIAARKGAIDRALHRAYGCTIWLIHSQPSAEQMHEYMAYRYQVVTIDPGREIVEARCRVERPPSMIQHAARWYASPYAGKPVEQLAPSAAEQPALAAPSGGWAPEW